MTDSQLFALGVSVMFKGFELGFTFIFAVGMSLGIVRFVRDVLG